jgi:uncharacterized membrane protein YeaQ/YmgE (transglycosylase-associated protein family)
LLLASSGEGNLEHTTMSILAWVILGLISGLIASKLTSSTGDGIIRNMFVGVIGALAGGAMSNLSMPGTDGITGFNLESLFVAVIGAALALVIKRALVGRGQSQTSRRRH